ncbi:MAG: Ig-like domain-containing protein [Candidatus Levyibacteriota bacterium]
MKINHRDFFKNNFRLLSFVAVMLLAILTPITILATNTNHASVTHAAGLHANPRTRLFYPVVRSKYNCARKTDTTAECYAKEVIDNNNNPITASSPQALRQRILQTFAPETITITPTTAALNPAALTANTVAAARLHTAYNIPCTPGGSVKEICSQPTTFGPQTIAIVDAYGDPNVESDLQTFDQYYGLPTCTKANGCLQVINQNGQTSSLPTRTDWIDEITLDVQTAHSLCQTCKILLVEANSSSYNDLTTATKTAASLHPSAISLSWGGSESSGVSSAPSYSSPGIPVIASSGDDGYNILSGRTSGVSFPASLPNVVAVGGTTLTVNSDDSYAGESVWNGTGSGCASLSSATANQTNLAAWSLTGCGTKRGVVDMAADADPSTGVAVYFNRRWAYYGGTSLAAPIIASAFALNGGIKSTSIATNVLYANYSPTNYHDITTGTNGTCSTTMCIGSLGYDGPTGLGTLNGLGAFADTIASPTATPSVTVTPTITATPTVTLTPIPTLIATPTPAPKAPTVSITNPSNGSTVQRRNTITIRAKASDPTGISKVEFYVNNILQCTDTTSSYTCNWRIPNQSRVRYTLSAKAYNRANITATSSVNVTSSF